MKLDIDSQRLVDRLADVQERQSQLAEETVTLKAELRQRLAAGVRYTDDAGHERVQLRANRRFSPDLAKTVIEPAVLAQCYVPTLDSKRVKATVPPALYEQCQVDGDPSVVLL